MVDRLFKKYSEDNLMWRYFKIMSLLNLSIFLKKKFVDKEKIFIVFQ